MSKSREKWSRKVKKAARRGLVRAEVVVLGMSQHYNCGPELRESAELAKNGVSVAEAMWASAYRAADAEAAAIADSDQAVGDSADPQYHGGGFVVETRCAGYEGGGHSIWAYGPVFTSQEAAEAYRSLIHERGHRCTCGKPS